MIFNTSYYDKEVKLAINQLVGQPYSIWKRLQLGGIGSMRMIIEEAHPLLQPYLKPVPQLTYANIELRPQGILIHMNTILKVFTWAIPYQQTRLLLEEKVSIHDQEKFLIFRDGYAHNQTFFNKLMKLIPS
ncbi:MAG: hypothetical protein ACPGJS_05795 [Flammeovirgaceae bacterium]